MEFVVDKENRRVKVVREFAAPLKNVWAAWTQKELLDEWWAPRPWKTKTKSIDVKNNGHWLYSMLGPEGEEHFCRVDFKSVVPMKNFKTLGGFCDSNGNITDELPVSTWNCEFSEASSKTIVTVEIEYETLADLEKYIEMGFKEGFTMALGNLDELFAAA